MKPSSLIKHPVLKQGLSTYYPAYYISMDADAKYCKTFLSNWLHVYAVRSIEPTRPRSNSYSLTRLWLLPDQFRSNF